jgi:DegV family protein with EDD domain
MIPRVKFLMVMGTLKYLIKGGRAPKSAVLGEMMKVKPIIGMVSGTGLVENMGRARGKRKAMEKIAEMTKEYIDISKPVHLMVHYTDDIAAGEELKEIVTSRLNCTEVYLTPYTPVMACHTGPVVSIAFYS